MSPETYLLFAGFNATGYYVYDDHTKVGETAQPVILPDDANVSRSGSLSEESHS